MNKWVTRPNHQLLHNWLNLNRQTKWLFSIVLVWPKGFWLQGGAWAGSSSTQAQKPNNSITKNSKESSMSFSWPPASCKWPYLLSSTTQTTNKKCYLDWTWWKTTNKISRRHYNNKNTAELGTPQEQCTPPSLSIWISSKISPTWYNLLRIYLPRKTWWSSLEISLCQKIRLSVWWSVALCLKYSSFWWDSNASAGDTWNQPDSYSVIKYIIYYPGF